MANGGTLFLDEISNLSYELQAALLRTVQERKVKRIGSTKEIDLDVRILVATNENLGEAIQKGRFREDLFHRFNEFNITVPPLRERGKDIMIFAEHFLKEANSELNRSVTDISDEVIECLMTYNWPGNIRELKNVIRRATLLSEENQIQLKALPLEISTLAKTSAIENVFGANIAVNSNKHSIKNAAIEAEYKTIINVLKEVNFNKTKAAKILKIDRKTLYNKMKLTNPEN
jgi:two-component system response regulator HydG